MKKLEPHEVEIRKQIAGEIEKSMNLVREHFRNYCKDWELPFVPIKHIDNSFDAFIKSYKDNAAKDEIE